MKGIKFDDFKLDWTLLPYQPVAEVIKVLMCGACKYFRDNWQNVDKVRYKKALMRHATAYAIKDEILDEDYKLHHLAHLVCCALFLIWFDIRDKMYIPFEPDYKAIQDKYDKIKKQKGIKR
jgi:hypothetical protein